MHATWEPLIASQNFKWDHLGGVPAVCGLVGVALGPSVFHQPLFVWPFAKLRNGFGSHVEKA